MVPLIWNAPDPQEKLQAYVDLYLREEVKAEALVRQIGEFSRFLEAIAFSHGSVLNLTNVSREAEVPRKTVTLHLQILIDLLLGFTIPVFENRAKREVIAHPKFYYFDPGVFRILRKRGFLDQSSEMEGAALEGLVAEHLRCWIDAQKEKIDLFFWHTRAGLEVDFVLYGPSHFIAIEVKNNKTITPNDLRGLKEFAKDFPEAKTFFLYRGSDTFRRDNILCIPADLFLPKINPLADALFL
jgi:predicted AAA+ superfamily ATPase